MSRETANAARFNKGLCVLTELEGELLEALEGHCSACRRNKRVPCGDCSSMVATKKAFGDQVSEFIALGESE